MNKQTSQLFLESFVTQLKDRGQLPNKIEVSAIGGTTIANAYDQPGDFVISEFVFTGMAPDPSLAVLKALVEKIERSAYANGYKSELPACKTTRSDGFAAYPVRAAKKSSEQARQNAYHEAIERYVWATWWDDTNVKHTTNAVETEKLSPASADLISELRKTAPLKGLFSLTPEVQNSASQTIIVFAELESGGYISGGACGPNSDQETTLYRGLCELVRHGITVHHFNETKSSPKSFYEKRLHFFAFDPRGRELLQNRLTAGGTTSIVLPRLAIDEEIPHDLSDLVYVHRCYFENQPPFVGGELERFCL